jgi:hypothetical protein
MVIGMGLMSLSLFGIVVFYQLQNSIGIIAMIGFYIFCFQGSMGPITFIHVIETCHPSQIGFVSFTLFFWNIAMCFLGTWLIDTFGAAGMFSFYSACTLFGTFYMQIFAKDTTFAEDDWKINPQSDIELT